MESPEHLNLLHRHYIQQQIGQELEIGRIQVRTEFGEKVLEKQAELAQAVEDATLGFGRAELAKI